MTLVHTHHGRRHRRTAMIRAVFTRFIKRAGTTFKKIHLAIAAAKIHRLRNELMLHSDSYDRWMHPDAADGDPEWSSAKFPRRPMVLGDKWDF
jgi:hypothetical protein